MGDAALNEFSKYILESRLISAITDTIHKEFNA